MRRGRRIGDERSHYVFEWLEDAHSRSLPLGRIAFGREYTAIGVDEFRGAIGRIPDGGKPRVIKGDDAQSAGEIADRANAGASEASRSRSRRQTGAGEAHGAGGDDNDDAVQIDGKNGHEARGNDNNDDAAGESGAQGALRRRGSRRNDL